MIDVAEVAHQLDDDRTGITVIAARVLVLHGGAALAGGFALSAYTRAGRPSNLPQPTSYQRHV